MALLPQHRILIVCSVFLVLLLLVVLAATDTYPFYRSHSFVLLCVASVVRCQF